MRRIFGDIDIACPRCRQLVRVHQWGGIAFGTCISCAGMQNMVPQPSLVGSGEELSAGALLHDLCTLTNYVGTLEKDTHVGKAYGTDSMGHGIDFYFVGGMVFGFCSVCLEEHMEACILVDARLQRIERILQRADPDIPAIPSFEEGIQQIQKGVTNAGH